MANDPIPTPDTATAPPAAGCNGPAGTRFSPEDVLDDWRWAYEQINNRQFDVYHGQHVAVVGRRVLGSGHDWLQLRERVAAEHDLPLERVVVVNMEMGDH